MANISFVNQKGDVLAHREVDSSMLNTILSLDAVYIGEHLYEIAVCYPVFEEFNPNDPPKPYGSIDFKVLVFKRNY